MTLNAGEHAKFQLGITHRYCHGEKDIAGPEHNSITIAHNADQALATNAQYARQTSNLLTSDVSTPDLASRRLSKNSSVATWAASAMESIARRLPGVVQ
jgi:hypothetical protein